MISNVDGNLIVIFVWEYWEVFNEHRFVGTVVLFNFKFRKMFMKTCQNFPKFCEFSRKDKNDLLISNIPQTLI
jgi:hypothetical protein